MSSVTAKSSSPSKGSPGRCSRFAAEDNPSSKKIHVYEESKDGFGILAADDPNSKPVVSGNLIKKSNRTKKFSFDHTCMDTPSDQLLRELFASFDKKGTGLIDMAEFRAAYKTNFDNFGAPMEDRDVDRIFSKLTSGSPRGKKPTDHELTFDEFCVLILGRYKL